MGFNFILNKMRFFRRKFFYSPADSLQVQEINRFWLKIGGVIAVGVIGSVILILAANHYYYDFLGLGYNKIDILTHDNQILQKQLEAINSRMKGLEANLNEVGRQGNQLRLMVDLPPIDDQTRVAGIGGAIGEPDFELTSDAVAGMLHSAYGTLQKLSAESKIQSKNYEQILKKYEYNKGYFSALPALQPMEGYYSPKGFGLRMHPVLDRKSVV